MENKQNVVIYARISTNQEKQNIKQQVELLKQFAIPNNYNVLRIFRDEGTGKNCKRKGYQGMLKFLSSNIGVDILVQDSNRLTRSFYDGVELEKFVMKNDIEIISKSETIDLETSNGRFMWRVKLAMNCFYVEDMVDKIMVGVARAKKEGKYKGRRKGAVAKKK